MKTNSLVIKDRFILESGKSLPEVEISYQTSGTLSPSKDNVLWVCHALTANADVEDWWDGLVGPGKYYDSEKYYIICANVLGSCYGSTGPLSQNPETGKGYFLSFPELTVRDLVNAHILLRKHLGIEKIHSLIGGSIGGFQALEWSIIEPSVVDHLVFVASSGRVSPWATAFNESQRIAIRADKTYFDEAPEGGDEGLKAARSIALLSYRNGQTYNKTQQEEAEYDFTDLKASSYQRYQGQKLSNRFNAYSYEILTRLIDSHDIGRNRGGFEAALSRIKANTLVIGISSDLLFPPTEQEAVHNGIKNSQLSIIDSFYGHDGFLIETEELQTQIENFYQAK